MNPYLFAIWAWICFSLRPILFKKAWIEGNVIYFILLIATLVTFVIWYKEINFSLSAIPTSAWILILIAWVLDGVWMWLYWLSMEWWIASNAIIFTNSTLILCTFIFWYVILKDEIDLFRVLWAVLIILWMLVLFYKS